MSLRSRASEIVYGLYERRLNQQIERAQRRPRHIGLMLDGNRRWAMQAGLTGPEGHQAGARKIAELLRWCAEADIEVVTLYLASTDNIVSRAPAEVSALLGTVADVVDELAAPSKPWRLRIVGTLDVLPPDIATRLTAAAARSADRAGGQVNIAVGYGGRREIADAVRKLLLKHAEAGTTIDELAEVIDVEHIAEHLYTSGQPDPDLVIRTSGEQRLSDFLLWQSAYSELWFCEAYWPDFRRTDFLRALRDYAIRHRRFGS